MSVQNNSFFGNLKNDLPASLVVFLVALPLCLGIALASGASPISGIIAGVVGGIVVALLSKSPLGVSGPAAGLAVIVFDAIQSLGSFNIFLVAVVLAGVFQMLLGFFKAGVVAYYFPSSVIRGMLSGIGIIIFLKQIPHAFGYDKDPEGDFRFFQMDGENTFTELINMLNYVSPAAVAISIISLLILILWETKAFKKMQWTTFLQGPLIAVVFGILAQGYFQTAFEGAYALNPDQYVVIPLFENGVLSSLQTPDWSAGLMSGEVWVVALTLAVVASLETLLCVEATDKLDPQGRVTPTNRELIAQGTGNMISGLIGGLPVTQVIVRSSANIQSGGRTKASAFFHGIILCICVLSIPKVLNLIPLSTLAAILLVVGYKLAKPALFKVMYSKGMEQFIPFIITILGIVFIDLLKGIALGMVIAVIQILWNNFKIPFHFHREKQPDGEALVIHLAEEVTFLNKARILKTLDELPDNSHLILDASNTYFIHPDIIEIIETEQVKSASRNITIELLDFHPNRGVDQSSVTDLMDTLKDKK